MPYSPKAKAWQRSSVGESLSCVAVCQIIDHPDVKCQTESEFNVLTNHTMNIHEVIV